MSILIIKALNKIIDCLIVTLVGILSFPLTLFYLFDHAFEEAQKKNQKLNDKLFMRRFNFKDQEHLHDYIEWNKEYLENRRKENENYIL